MMVSSVLRGGYGENLSLHAVDVPHSAALSQQEARVLAGPGLVSWAQIWAPAWAGQWCGPRSPEKPKPPGSWGGGCCH